MIITEILPLGAKKSKVLTDEDFAFSLYRGEVKKMELEVGRELTADFLRTELYPSLIRRSRERLLYLLKQRDYTEAEKVSGGLLPGGNRRTRARLRAETALCR